MTSSSQYARRFQGVCGAWLLEQQRKCTLALMARGAGDTLLEVGGGHGQLTGALADCGFHVFVMGSRATACQGVRSLLREGRCHFQSGDLFNMPFDNNAFDAVVAFHLLAHVCSPRALVAELCRVAARTVVVNFPSRNSLNRVGGPLFGLKLKIEGNTRPYTVFSCAEIAAMFQTHGYRQVGQRAQFFLPMVLHRVLNHVPLTVTLERIFGFSGLTHRWGSPVIARFDAPVYVRRSA